jgi:RNA polymerase sigma-70 factor (ECF subfamily)
MRQLADNTSINLDPSTWLEQHGDVLFRYAVARVRDASVAEDLVQETLLAAMGSVGSFQAGSTERTWLTGILRHKLLDFFRRTARERKLEEDWSSSPAGDNENFDVEGSWRVAVGEWGSPEKSLAKTEFWDVFNGCMDALPEPLRTPFALRELEGLDSDAVVKTLNISSKNNLWVMLSRARQRLRSCLQAQWFEET